MSNIIAVSPNEKEIICENYVTKVKEALDYWKYFGMSNCLYKAVKIKYIPKEILNYNI